MSDITTQWAAAKASLTKEAGIKEILATGEKAIAKGRHAFSKAAPEVPQEKMATISELWALAKEAKNLKPVVSAVKGVTKATKPGISVLAQQAENAAKGSKPLLTAKEIKALPAPTRPAAKPTPTPAAVAPVPAHTTAAPVAPAVAAKVPMIDALKHKFNALSGKQQHGVMAGGAAALTGAGALGGGLLGHSAGVSSGTETGAAQGFDAGVQAGSQQASVDPGVLGRLMEVFTGRQGAPPAVGDPAMAAARQAAIQKIISGK